MIRKRPTEEHPNHERWVLSYADFVTLMFALFVAMYAISLKDKTTGQRVSESVRKAVATGGLQAAVQTLFTQKPHASQEKATAKSGGDGSLIEPFRQLSQALQEEIRSGAVRLQLDARGLVITLQEKTFFPSGGEQIYPSAYGSVGKVAKILKKLPNPVRLEGHTDSVPISNERFKNNWELSTARSIALLGVFQNQFAIAPDRFSVAGYAQNQPVASNETPEGRARNRRVEIVILEGRHRVG